MGKDWKEKGFVLCPKALLFSPRLSATDLKIYLTLRGHRNAVTGLCFPSLRIIAEEAGLNRNTVNMARNRLKRLGVLNWTSNKRVKKSSLYDFPLEYGSESEQARLCEELRLSPPVGNHTGKGGGVAPSRQRLSPPVGNPILPENQAQNQAGCGFDTDLGLSPPVGHNYLIKEKKKKNDSPKSKNGESASLGEGTSPTPINALQKEGGLRKAMEKRAHNLYRSVFDSEPSAKQMQRIVTWIDSFSSGHGISDRMVRNMIKTLYGI